MRFGWRCFVLSLTLVAAQALAAPATLAAPAPAAAQATLAAPAIRIASLDLCSDWLLAYYATDPAMVSLSPLSRRTPLPPSIQGSAKPWATPRFQEHDGSLEQVLSGQPDVVIVGEFNAFMLRKRLESLGLRVIVTALPNTIDDVALVASRVQALLNDAASPSGKASAQSLQASPIGSGDAKTQGLGPNRIVAAAGSHGRLLLLGPNGYGTGRNTIEHSLITRAGWINYIKNNGRVKLDLEAIAADPPDAILSFAASHTALAHQFAQHPVLKRAVPPHRWIKTDAWRWQCPGPWMDELIEQLQP